MNKRRYHNRKQEYDITVDFLLNEPKLLTKREFCSFLSSNYDTYKEEFLKLQFTKFYGHNYNENWFLNKYINRFKPDFYTKIKEFSDFDTQNVTLDNNNINLKMFSYHPSNIIMEVWKKDSVVDLKEMISSVKGFLELNTYYTYHKGEYKFFALISVEADTNLEEFAMSLRRMTDVVLYIQPFVIENDTYNTTNINLTQTDKINSYKLIKMYCKRYNVDYKIEDASADYYILFLRYVFNHCYYCAKQFDSVIHMIRECGEFHIRTNNNVQRRAFDRKNQLLIATQDTSYLRNIDPNFFYRYVTYEDSISCVMCKKSFASAEHIESHYKKQHFDELIKYDDIVVKNEKWTKFCENIDTRVVAIAIGIEDWFLPDYVMRLDINYANGNMIVYDMGHIFSGEITL